MVLLPSSPKVIALNASSAQEEWIKLCGMDRTSYIAEASFVLAFGGPDISPSLYRQSRHPLTTSGDVTRDQAECLVMRSALLYGVPCVGICRGGQLIHALHGGSLAQHVDGHMNDHIIMKTDGSQMTSSSTHHQMMLTVPPEGEVLAWGNESTTRQWTEQHNVVKATVPMTWSDPEVIYYKNSRSIAFQPHPEYEGYDELTAFFWQLIDQKILNDAPLETLNRKAI